MKKKEQLGMNPSTASHRLVKDILWNRIVQYEICYHCKESMTRDTFSIEHKAPWLDSDNPLEVFFDQGNIAFSHRKCNISAARKTKTSKEYQKERKAKNYANWYTPEKRHSRYIETGK